jgi:hypothetical protein
MRYWDSSAILPLLAREVDTQRCNGQFEEDPRVVTWWGSRIECVSALNRLAREGALGTSAFDQTVSDLDALSSDWMEIQPTERLRQRAMRLLGVHALRTADALQLAAALIACGENPRILPFVCADPRLIDAARKEGFPLLP